MKNLILGGLLFLAAQKPVFIVLIIMLMFGGI